MWTLFHGPLLGAAAQLQAGAGDQAITGALFTDADTFFGSTVSTSYTVTGALYSDADTFFGATVSTSYDITGALYTDPDTFFAATVSQAVDQTITGALYANDNTFFAATVSEFSISADRGGDGFPAGGIRRRRKHRHTTRDQLEKLLKSTAEEPPPPTKKRVKAIKEEILEEVSGGLGAPEKRELAQFVQREVVQAYQPTTDWAALIAAYEHIMRLAAEEAERIEQEIEEEDEMILMMVA